MLKFFRKIPPVVISFILFLVIPALFFLASTNTFRRLYYEQSSKSLEMCFEQIERHNLPQTVCYFPHSTANSAFSMASSIYNPIIILLMVVIFTLTANLISMKREINELKEKLDV